MVSAGIPLTDYNIELLPLSIGTGSSRLSGRFTANLQASRGWYVNGSTAYIWRSNTTLDRPYFFTNDEFVMSDQVDMPNVFDYVLNLGYMKNGLNANFAFSQQQTLGGGDIRRQDIPFASNRMNFIKVGGMVPRQAIICHVPASGSVVAALTPIHGASAIAAARNQ